MSQHNHYTQLEEHVDSPKEILRVTFTFVSLCAVIYAVTWTFSLPDTSRASVVDMPMLKPMTTGALTRPFPPKKMGLEQQPGLAGLRGAVTVARALQTNQMPDVAAQLRKTLWAQDHNKFHYENDVKFDFEEIPASDLEDLQRQGWVFLDVRAPDQVHRAKVLGALEVPLYVLANDKSLYGIYQELAAFGLGGWWGGGRPMRENLHFTSQVMAKVTRDTPGIIVGCQTGLRSRQAMKELHLAGFRPKMKTIKGGFERVKPGELCSEDSCIVPQGAKIQLAGSGNIAAMLGWKTN
jgi:rhodanese-related sulfurtransferase